MKLTSLSAFSKNSSVADIFSLFVYKHYASRTTSSELKTLSEKDLNLNSINKQNPIFLQKIIKIVLRKLNMSVFFIQA